MYNILPGQGLGSDPIQGNQQIAQGLGYDFIGYEFIRNIYRTIKVPFENRFFKVRKRQ